jgi:hypothetical protein
MQDSREPRLQRLASADVEIFALIAELLPIRDSLAAALACRAFYNAQRIHDMLRWRSRAQPVFAELVGKWHLLENDFSVRVDDTFTYYIWISSGNLLLHIVNNSLLVPRAVLNAVCRHLKNSCHCY